MDSCIFCKIIKGEIPSYKVWEDDNYLAFLTIQPVKEGHTLVIPKAHDSYLFEMADEKLGPFMIAIKKVAQLLTNKLSPKTGKIGLAVAGQEVPHVHVHLIPMDQESDLRKPAKMVPHEQLEQALSKLTS